MKKVISIMVILCVAATLFAAGTFKIGGAYSVVGGSTGDIITEAVGDKLYYNTSGFGFDVSAKYSFGPLASWVDFNMTFNSDFKMRNEGTNEWGDIQKLAKHVQDEVGVAPKTSVIGMSGAAGIAFDLKLGPVDLALGGGIYAERLTIKASASVPSNSNNAVKDMAVTFRFVNFGITAYADVAYKLTENFGIGLTVMPRVGIYNLFTHTEARDKEVDTDKDNAFAASFGMPVVIGVTYSF